MTHTHAQTETYGFKADQFLQDKVNALPEKSFKVLAAVIPAMYDDESSVHLDYVTVEGMSKRGIVATLPRLSWFLYSEDLRKERTGGTGYLLNLNTSKYGVYDYNVYEVNAAILVRLAAEKVAAEKAAAEKRPTLKEIAEHGESVRHTIRILAQQIRSNEERSFNAAAKGDWDEADTLYERRVRLKAQLVEAETELTALCSLYEKVSSHGVEITATEDTVTEDTVTEDTVTEDTATETTATETTATEDTATEDTATEIPAPEIPAHDDAELLDQWRAKNRAGEGCGFGDPDDYDCEEDIYEAAEREEALVICALSVPDSYLVSWFDEYWVVCDCNGWWACRVTL